MTPYNIWSWVHTLLPMNELWRIRPCHLQIPGGPKMAFAALRRRTIDGPFVVMQRKSWAMPVYFLVARRATYGPYRPRLDGHQDGPKMAHLKWEGLWKINTLYYAMLCYTVICIALLTGGYSEALAVWQADEKKSLHLMDLPASNKQ